MGNHTDANEICSSRLVAQLDGAAGALFGIRGVVNRDQFWRRLERM